jgi:hypothetical protein
MEAKARHFRTRRFRSLQQRVVIGNLDLFAVNFQFCQLRILHVNN